MNYYTLTQISLETGLPEERLRRLSHIGIFYVNILGGLIRIAEDEYRKLRHHLRRGGEKRN